MAPGTLLLTIRPFKFTRENAKRTNRYISLDSFQYFIVSSLHQVELFYYGYHFRPATLLPGRGFMGLYVVILSWHIDHIDAEVERYKLILWHTHVYPIYNEINQM